MNLYKVTRDLFVGPMDRWSFAGLWLTRETDRPMVFSHTLAFPILFDRSVGQAMPTVRWAIQYNYISLSTSARFLLLKGKFFFVVKRRLLDYNSFHYISLYSLCGFSRCMIFIKSSHM